MTRRTLRPAPGLSLPLEVVTRTTGIVGQRGTGKTSTAAVLAEEASACGAQLCVIDPTGAWYGLRSSADGKGPGLPVVVFGGHHADVPLSKEHGPLLADLVVSEGYQAVLDLELMTKGDQLRLVAEFLEALYHKNREALMLVVDEAHRFAPQQLRDPGGYGARCLGALTDVVTLGRRKGLGAVLISQRPARLNKDVLEQAEVLFAHRLMGPNDRKAISAWLAEADEEAAQEAASALEGLRKLHRGEALVYAPEMGVYGRYAIRAKETFDSSATPDVGVKAVEPVGRAEVDMDVLEERMASVLEKAKEDDPRELRKELAQTRTKLRLLEQETVGAEAELAGLREELENRPAETVQLTDLDREVLQSAVAELKDALEPFGVAVWNPEKKPEPPKKMWEPGSEPPPRPAAPPRPAKPAVPETIEGNGEVRLKAGARRMALALAWLHPEPLSRQQVATLAGMSAKSGTFGDYLSALRRAGVIEERGHHLVLSEQGLREFGADVSSGAPTPGQMKEMWAGKFKAGARRMLDVLMDAYPNWLTRDELAEAVEMAKSSGTFGDYLSALRRNGLLEEESGALRAGPALFLGQ